MKFQSLSIAILFAALPLAASAAQPIRPMSFGAGISTDTAAVNTYLPCTISQSTVATIQATLATVVLKNNGGLFTPSRMWSAVVDRSGHVCSVIRTGDAWPGSRAIALAKAWTADAFSNSALSLSTTMLYASTQPGGSLWGLNESNPFNPSFYVNNLSGVSSSTIAGGIITFGGGLALYQNGQVIGGLGVSGDSSCADHVIAYRMRRLAGFDKIPGAGASDNISYPASGPATGFEQPHCFPGLDLAPSAI